MESRNQFKISSRLISSPTGDGDVQELSISYADVEMTCLSYGATITSIKSPDKTGKVEEITLCYRNKEYFQKLIGKDGPYYGCIAGRVANRIRGGKFSLSGVEYSLAVNNGKNHLHGGILGFDKKHWHWAIIHSDSSSAGAKLVNILSYKFSDVFYVSRF